MNDDQIEISADGQTLSEILIYQTEDGSTRIEARLVKESVWLSLNQMAELFKRDKSVISRHIRNVFSEGELPRDTTIANFATVQKEGEREVVRDIEYFNLDVIISVGYRVKSLRGTQFRIWATQRLRDYIIKGFTMDDKKLKEAGGGAYFDELLARIRDIRSSEKVFYKKVLEIYATSIDYSPDAESSKLFFKTVQNKMHWAAHGQTAAEIVHDRADANKPYMGLTAWAGDRPHKADVAIAKNYLNQPEIDTLNRIVTLYLEFAELQASQRRPMYMKDWIQKLDDFLKISERQILEHAGKVSQENARLKAEAEYDKFKTIADSQPSPVEKHFDQTIKDLKTIEGKKHEH